MRPPARHRLLPIGASLLLAGCDTSGRVAGGAGSEAGNALSVLVRDSTGAPVASARVQLRPAGADDPLPAFEALTGADGRASFRAASGAWSILVRKGDLAAWSVSAASDTLRIDTLGATSRVAGFLAGRGSQVVSFPGLGLLAPCDGDGFFQVSGLPAGILPVRVGASAVSDVHVEAGVPALVLGGGASAPWPSLPADSLVPWASRPLPASLPGAALGDTGSFSVAVSLRRTDSVTMVRAIDWSDGAGNGIQVDWKGRDTMVLRVDGVPYRVSGFLLDTGWKQLGLSWDGRRLAVVRGADSVLSLTSGSLSDRTGWEPPRFGSAGASGVRWIAFQRGGRISDWLRRLSVLESDGN